MSPAQKESNCMAEMSRDQVIARIEHLNSKRCDLITNYRCGSAIEEMEPADDGDWLRYEDVGPILDACLTLLRQQQEPQKPQPLDHYWTPDPTKRFCVICGDNGLGSPWGVHRFQIQPHDPDFKPSPPAGDT
jgi:hypothetical protein